MCHKQFHSAYPHALQKDTDELKGYINARSLAPTMLLSASGLEGFNK